LVERNAEIFGATDGRGGSMTAGDRVRAGDLLGSYELLSRVGRGGMATVWAARHHGAHGFSKIVALKTMLAELSDDTDFQRMFLTEARVAARIRHQNVVETLDLGEDQGLLYIAMEWVDGETLSAIMKSAFLQGGVPLPIALKLIVDACAGVHAAHELRDDEDRPLGVVHRDVSPPNILVSYGGIVKLADFGVAKSMESNNGATLAGQVKGKLRYMAPEQLLGASVDRRTDIFALAISLYQLTTGRHPWPGDTAAVTVQRILSESPVAPASFVEGYPAELENIVLKALQRNPAERHASAAELAVELEEFARTSGGLASTRDVAAYVQELLGAHGSARRDGLRKAIREVDARGTRETAIALRSIDAKWDEEAPPVVDTPLPPPPPAPLLSRMSRGWEQLAALSRSARSRRALAIGGAVLLLTTVYALAARRSPEVAVAAAAEASTSSSKASAEPPALACTDPQTPPPHPYANVPTATSARKEGAARPAVPVPPARRVVVAPQPATSRPTPSAATDSDPDVGF
jgi:serine/threonine-protein kinase